MTKDLESKQIVCPGCSYKWDFKPKKRPNPRSTSCPNCTEMVELRESKLN